MCKGCDEVGKHYSRGVKVAPASSSVPICRCGCGCAARWLGTGDDYDGTKFTDEPMCDSAAYYCEESAAECGHEFTKRPIL